MKDFNFKLLLRIISIFLFIFLQQNEYHLQEMGRPTNPLPTIKASSKQWHEKKRYAFLVGINKYKNTTELKYAVKDSREIYKLFSQVGHFEKIFMLNDEDGKVIVTKGKVESRDKQYLPTKANIEATYKSILAEKPDTLVFYYSGHGFIDGKDDKNSIAPMDVEVNFVAEKAVPKNGIVLTEMANGFKTEAEKAKETDKDKLEIDQVIFLIDACRSPLPKADMEMIPNQNKKELSKEENIKAANTGKPEPSKEKAKEIPKEDSIKELISFQNYGEEIPEIVNDAKGVVILIGTSPNEASLEDESIQSGKFTYYMRKAISGGIQDETPAEYVTLESLEIFVKKKLNLEQAEYEKIAREKGIYEVSQNKGKQAVYKVSTQRGFTGDFLIAYGRPPETEVRVERRGYMDTSEERPVAAKLLFNKNKERYDLKFFAKSKDTGKYYPESLEGVSRMKYAFDRNKMGDLQGFTAEQYNYNEEPVYSHGLELNEENGWEFTSLYPLTEEDKKDKDKKRIRFQRQKFDFNGNNILQEYFDDKGQPVAIGSAEITKTIRAWDYNGEKTLEEFYNAKGELTNNKNGYARYTASYLGKGKPVSEEYFGSDGKLSSNQTGIARKTFTYDPEYKLVSQKNFDKDGNLIGDKDGVAVTNYTYNNVCVDRIWSLESTKEIYSEANDKAKSELTEKFKRKETYADCIATEVYLGKSEKSKARPSGIAKKENQFNNKGLKTLEQYFRHDERPWHKGGIFRTVYDYDDKDRVTAKKFFGETRNTTLEPVPVTDERGIHEYRYQYGTTGGGKYHFGYKKELLERVTYHGVGGKLVSTAEGVSIEEHLFTYNREKKDYEEAVVHYLDAGEEFVRADNMLKIYDENGNSLLDEEFSENGKVVKSLRVVQYDSKGNQIRVEGYEGNNYKLTGRQFYQYDEQGNNTLKEYHGPDGKLIGDEYGIARTTKKYNASGKCVSEEWQGADGKFKEISGIARIVFNYDEKGSKISEEFQDVNRKLIDSPGGMAKIIFQYDGNGNEISREFKNAEGNSTEWKGVDIARIVRRFDSNGNILLEETNDLEGKLKEGKSFSMYGIARRIYQYDLDGNLILEETFGANEKLKDYKNGPARTINKYDKKGNIILTELFGEDGKLKNFANPSYTVYHYDEMGNILLKENYGVDGNLKDFEWGGEGARIVYRYDTNGNMTLKEVYGADGKFKKYGYVYPVKFEYEYDNILLEDVKKKMHPEWKLIENRILDAIKGKSFLKKDSNIQKQIIDWKEKIDYFGLYQIIIESLGKEKAKQLTNDLNDFAKKYENEVNWCKLRDVAYNEDGSLSFRIERLDNNYHRLTTEIPNSNGVLESPEYHLYFPNPRGQFEKRLLHMKLDRFYRPVGLEFEKR